MKAIFSDISKPTQDSEVAVTAVRTVSWDDDLS